MFSKFSVNKPFTVIVAIIIVLILGGVSYTNMTVDLIPSINLPYAMITTAYPGASPEEVETRVSSVVEQSMASISNMEAISSISSENISMVILQFTESANMDTAMIEMREGLDMITSYLPDGAGSPVIMKINPDMMPVMVMSAAVEGTDIRDSSQFLESKILPELKSVEGVASVSASGLVSNVAYVSITQEKIDAVNQRIYDKILEQAQEQIQQQIDATLAEMGLPAGTVIPGVTDIEPELPEDQIPKVDMTKEMLSQILQGQNLSMPSGSVEEDGISYLVRTGDKFRDFDELADMVILSIPDMDDITLGDIAEIVKTDDSASKYCRVNGESAAILSLQKQSEYSTAEVTEAIQNKLPKIQDSHEGVQFQVLMDQGEYVHLMMDTIIQNLVFGGLLAILILWLFLKSIKPTFVVGLSIVISVITTFVLIYFSGITMNLISMSGLALGVGMLVDNSIVVIENIFRLRSQGVDRKRAASEGAKQVSGAITASTLTTIIVFVPIIFTEGLTRQLFTDMALTIAFSLLASLLVALTLVPMASATLLKKEIKGKNRIFSKFQTGYTRLLNHALNHKWVTILLVFVLFVTSILASFSLGTELFPSGDTGNISVSVEMPDDFGQEDTFVALDQLSSVLNQIPAIETAGILYSEGSASSMSMMGMGGGTTIYVRLDENRSMSTDEVVQEIRDRTEGFAFRVSVSSAGADLSSLSGGSIAVNVFGSELDELREAAQMIAETLGEVEGAIEIDSGLGKESQEIRITVDKSKALQNGVTTAQVYLAVAQALAADTVATTMTVGDQDVDVYVKDERTAPVTSEDLESIEVPKATGEGTVTVGEVATLEKADGFQSIRHSGQERYVSVTGSLKEGYNIGKVSAVIEEKLSQLTLPAGTRYEIAGENQSIQDAFSDLYLMLILAIVFIYLVMVAQFQSLLSPFIVMFTIPLAFTGGFFALYFAGMPLSVVALIGLILLMGIVVNNGIVFVDYVNQMRRQGLSKREALLETGRDRIRPILMTALTTILALTTMAFDQSAGAVMMKPLALTTIGGLIYATVLTLFIVPVLYDVFHRRETKVHEPQEANAQ
ncbi:MAG: efflux RND transporter permease subunit [Clostridia bacterium]